MSNSFRIETDLLGEQQIDAKSLNGIHTRRACENFPFTTRPVPEAMIRAYGLVKQAALTMCAELDVWSDYPERGEALKNAAAELALGKLSDWIVVDLMQGGAGTSLNMNVNEVICNRALQILKKQPGDYSTLSPTDDANCYQSTNDTYPTALRLAAINGINLLENKLVALQESFQQKEKEFAHITKVGRTQLQDAVLTTLGREMAGYAEAINRDRWRIYKCVERLRTINLGGTAIGSGLGAERKYIFGVVEKLRELTGIGFARSENLSETTSNSDAFVEVSGILKTCASNLLKISTDLRLLSGSFKEINLPPMQAGSSIMPGKINPVIPEAVSQAAMQVIANDMAITNACSAGTLELNPFLPLVTWNLLDSIDLLSSSVTILDKRCVTGITANEEVCSHFVESSTAVITALIPKLGYQHCSEITKKASQSSESIRSIVVGQNIIEEKEFDYLISPEAVCQLGFRKTK